MKFLKKVYTKFFLTNSFYINFILKSYNKIYNSSKRSNYDYESRIINNEIFLVEFEKVKRNYNNYYVLVDRKYNIKSYLKYKYKTITSTFDLKNDEIKNSLFFIAIQQEDIGIKEIENIKKNSGYYQIAHFNENNTLKDFYQSTSYRFINSNCLNAIKNTLKKNSRISHIYSARLNTHENICEGLDLTKNVEGDYVEIGVYKGGSALTALNYLKITKQEKKSYFLDTYEGFNYEDAKNSSDVNWANTHFISKDIQLFIKETLKEFDKYELIKSNIIEDNLPEKIRKISLANIDVDLEEATYSAIVKVSEKLSLHGIIMCEDPVHTPYLYGAKYAMEKFLNSEEGKNKYLKIFKKNHYFLIKIK